MESMFDNIIGSMLAGSAMEKNVDALAEVKAECMYRQYRKSCDAARCLTCAMHDKLMSCYVQLSLCDQLKVDTRADKLFAERVCHADAIRHDTRANRMSSVIGYLLPFAFGIVMLLFARACFGEPVSVYDDIGNVVEQTHSQVRDKNYDGKVDCVDWSLTFKGLWEKSHGFGTCILVENHNERTDMHHMFVKVSLVSNIWTFVEPQGTRDGWAPYDVWGDKYSPAYNRTAE